MKMSTKKRFIISLSRSNGPIVLTVWSQLTMILNSVCFSTGVTTVSRQQFSTDTVIQSFLDFAQPIAIEPWLFTGLVKFCLYQRRDRRYPLLIVGLAASFSSESGRADYTN